MPQSDESRALPPEGEGAPRSIAQRPPDAYGRPRSAPSAHGTGRLQPRTASAANNTAAPSSPPQGEGAPRLPPPTRRTLRQRGGSEPLAQTTRSASLKPGHTTSAVPGPVLSPDYHRQVLRGDKAGVVACGLPAGMPAGRDGRRQPHHPQPPPFPLRCCPGMAGTSASCADLRLGRPGQGLRWKFPRDVRAPWELVGSPELPPADRGIPARVHPAVFQAAHRVAQHHRREEGHALLIQRSVYFISEVLSETKICYPEIQKLLYAVILTRQKLRHYFESHPVTVVSSFPLGEII
jgi:hypothetical protein